MAAVQGPKGLQGLKPQHDVGFARGNQGALQIPQHHGGDHDAAPLGHAVGLAHHGVIAGSQGRLPQEAAGQERPWPPTPVRKMRRFFLGFWVLGSGFWVNRIALSWFVI